MLVTSGFLGRPCLSIPEVNRQNLKNAVKKQKELVKTAKQLSLSDLRKLVTAAEAAAQD